MDDRRGVAADCAVRHLRVRRGIRGSERSWLRLRRALDACASSSLSMCLRLSLSLSLRLGLRLSLSLRLLDSLRLSLLLTLRCCSLLSLQKLNLLLLREGNLRRPRAVLSRCRTVNLTSASVDSGGSGNSIKNLLLARRHVDRLTVRSDTRRVRSDVWSGGGSRDSGRRRSSLALLLLQ